jgi:alpha-tubulin suppressor-like RCC1 family protein
LKSTGQAKCWGHNNDGQLGNGTATDSTVPVVVSGVSDAVAIAAGDNHTCALQATATAKCWGDNTFGELGDGTTTNSSTPLAVSGL